MSKVLKWINRYIVGILISLGLLIAFSFLVYTSANGISRTNTVEAFIGGGLSYVPILIGLWILSNRIKEKKAMVSKILKGLVFFVSFVMIASVLSAIFL